MTVRLRSRLFLAPSSARFALILLSFIQCLEIGESGLRSKANNNNNNQPSDELWRQQQQQQQRSQYYQPPEQQHQQQRDYYAAGQPQGGAGWAPQAQQQQQQQQQGYYHDGPAADHYGQFYEPQQPSRQPQKQPAPGPPKSPKPSPFQSSSSQKADQCGTFHISESHGFLVREYKITTQDRYELKLHRLIHPADVKRIYAASGQQQQQRLDLSSLSDKEIQASLGHKKPYLLLHGLVGSSASFVRNVDKSYAAPGETFDVSGRLGALLRDRAGEFEPNWQSTADQLNGAFVGDTSNTLGKPTWKQKVTNSFARRTFAQTRLIDFAGDTLPFGVEFTQAYRKFQLPREALRDGRFVTNSLAFTLSNFGYDVWLLNLRGNHYSHGYNGPLNQARDAEYWNFNLDQLIKEDLLASINQVKKTTGAEQLGMVTYSYSSLHALGLLTKYAQYQQIVQPVIMLAPTLLSSSDRSLKTKMLIKGMSKLLISQTGPFPAHANKGSLERLVCKLPLASKLCNLMTIVLHGTTPHSVKEIISDDRQRALMLRDSECGQTSTRVLHQIIENISQFEIAHEYRPFVRARDQLRRGQLRRSVMLVRSQADELSSEAEIERIKAASLNGMTLAELVIQEPKFGHTDFLFSQKNQFLVNAEVARMALVFDFLVRSKPAVVK